MERYNFQTIERKWRNNPSFNSVKNKKAKKEKQEEERVEKN